MVIVIPAITGKIGSTVYYETTMKVQDFIYSVSPPGDIEKVENFSIEERMQRDPDIKRINTQLAPYIASSPDRFFGSIIVLIYKGEFSFEPITNYVRDVPRPYQSCTRNMGFLTIDEGTSMMVLDGQHRQIALKKVYEREIGGLFAPDIANDDICVIFIRHESKEKTRRIFNTVNRYAKQTSRGDNIITSEDDGYAILSRRLLEDGAPLATPKTMEENKDIVNWRSNTLTSRSVQLTTISVVYETVKLILDHYGVSRFQQQIRPSNEILEESQMHCEKVWFTILTHIEPYKSALENPGDIPNFRNDESKKSLLFKPAAQIALVDGLLQAMRDGGISLKNAVDRVAQIKDWRMGNSQWQGIIIKQSGTIDASQEARRRMAKLICYLIAADHLSQEVKFEIWKTYNQGKGMELDAEEKLLNLPRPLNGDQYTVEEGIKQHKKSKSASKKSNANSQRQSK